RGGGRGEKKKAGRLSTPRLAGCWEGLLLHLAAGPRGGRSRSRAARGGRAAALVVRVLLVVEERRLAVGLMLDAGIGIAEGRRLALELLLVEALPAGILPELGQDPLGRARRHIGGRRRLARLEADQVDEEEAAIQRRQQRQEDEQRPHRVGALLLDLLLDRHGDPGGDLALDAGHAAALAGRRGGRPRLFLDRFGRDGLFGRLIVQLEGLRREARVGVLFDEGL